nr:M15 family metallopeptidase [Neobacillus ginsengisoli]
MKNLLVIFASVFLIAGCSQMDSFFKKVPLLSKDSQEQKAVKTNKANQRSLTGKNSLNLQAIFFNEIKQVDGKNVIQNPTNILALINKKYLLPANYIPDDLVHPDVPFSFGDLKQEKSYMRKEAADALAQMFNDAKKSGIELYAVSGYRSYSRQKTLFDAEINQVGKEKAVQAVAIPGSSEHQSGLAMDIASKSTNLNLTEGFAGTREGKWLEENAHRFGFILRYPKGKEGITNYEYEPWHFRYVGVKAAKVIYQHDWTLEEYFNEVKKI